MSARTLIRQCRRCRTLYNAQFPCATCAQWDSAIEAVNARCNENAPPMPEPERDTREHATEAGRRDAWKGWAK